MPRRTPRLWRKCSPRPGTPRPPPEKYLVDDGWQTVAIEPETVSLNGNGNGHHDAEDIGLTVELVVNGDGQHSNGNGHHSLPSTGNGENGHVPVPANGNGNGNGHHDTEPAEGQQSLFSWAEFLAEEPARTNGRNGKPKTASASLFQWALDQEQEREKEPVGAGR